MWHVCDDRKKLFKSIINVRYETCKLPASNAVGGSWTSALTPNQTDLYNSEKLIMTLLKSSDLTDRGFKRCFMSMPDHAIWVELERYFQTSIMPQERQFIVEVVRHTVNENPDVDMDELTLKAAEAIIRRRIKNPSRDNMR